MPAGARTGPCGGDADASSWGGTGRCHGRYVGRFRFVDDDVARRPSMPMLAAAFGMALSAAVGSWVGCSEPALLGVSVLWAAGCAWLIEFGTGVRWIVLQ